jgi:hypothetical protein
MAVPSEAEGGQYGHLGGIRENQGVLVKYVCTCIGWEIATATRV